MINPYEFSIGSLRVVVYAPTKDEATRIFSESLEEYDTKVKADAIDEFVELINTMPTYENEYGEIMPMPIEMMAEQLKEKNSN